MSITQVTVTIAGVPSCLYLCVDILLSHLFAHFVLGLLWFGSEPNYQNLECRSYEVTLKAGCQGAGGWELRDQWERTT